MTPEQPKPVIPQDNRILTTLNQIFWLISYHWWFPNAPMLVVIVAALLAGWVSTYFYSLNKPT